MANKYHFGNNLNVAKAPSSRVGSGLSRVAEARIDAKYAKPLAKAKAVLSKLKGKTGGVAKGVVGRTAAVAGAGIAGWIAGKAIKRGVKGSNDKKIAAQKDEMNKLGARRAGINRAKQDEAKKKKLPERTGLPGKYNAEPKKKKKKAK